MFPTFCQPSMRPLRPQPTEIIRKILPTKFAGNYLYLAHNSPMMCEQTIGDQTTTATGYRLPTVLCPRSTIHGSASSVPCVSAPCSLVPEACPERSRRVLAFLTPGHRSMTTGFRAIRTTNHDPLITAFQSLFPLFPRSLVPCFLPTPYPPDPTPPYFCTPPPP
jgi:hypothetical protein